MAIDVTCKVQIHKINGEEVTGPEWISKKLVVKSCGYRTIEIIILDGTRYTLSARDLETAIKNAENSNRP